MSLNQNLQSLKIKKINNLMKEKIYFLKMILLRVKTNVLRQQKTTIKNISKEIHNRQYIS
jgi:hypothetical protein